MFFEYILEACSGDTLKKTLPNDKVYTQNFLLTVFTNVTPFVVSD